VLYTSQDIPIYKLPFKFTRNLFESISTSLLQKPFGWESLFPKGRHCENTTPPMMKKAIFMQVPWNFGPSLHNLVYNSRFHTQVAKVGNGCYDVYHHGGLHGKKMGELGASSSSQDWSLDLAKLEIFKLGKSSIVMWTPHMVNASYTWPTCTSQMQFLLCGYNWSR
jgi:hypothetical protein